MLKRYRLPTRIINDDMLRRQGPKYLPSRQRGALPGLENVTWKWVTMPGADGTGILEADVTGEQAAILAAQNDVIEV